MINYPIYIPSKDRADVCYTAKCFQENGVAFKIVVEPDQLKQYKEHFDESMILILPENGMRLLGSRLWIREHSISQGFTKHWQFDDNIRNFRMWHKGRRIECNPAKAIKVAEVFTDRYENIGISGFNYYMFTAPHSVKKPFTLNVHVYSASLINNQMPYKWRLYYNDDTDLCLQVLTNNMCTVLFNKFMVTKIRTGIVKGGNTDDLYQHKGRLKMARTLEEVWSEHVVTKWRFGRPQHVIKDNWTQFKTPLRLKKGISLDDLKKETPVEFNLIKRGEIKSESLKKYYEDYSGS